MATVAVEREHLRQRRLRRLALVLAVPALFMWARILTGLDPLPSLPAIPEDAMFWLPGIAIVLLLGVVLIAPLIGNARSPHIMFRPEQIGITFDDVRGMGQVVEEVRHTLQVLLDHQRFRTVMGGSPRRGVLFEGPPGTGKTHVAKAMAKEAGVPFLFVSSTAFQSMWYGMTARRIKSYFRALRKAARAEGGAIGFIEEIDAIGMRRGGQEAAPGSAAVNKAMSSDTGGVVNELLIQMQSFDDPTTRQKFAGWVFDRVNRYLPEERQLRRSPSPYSNVLLIGATNRATALDPALLRPGRFDRTLHFGLPGKSARRELVDYFLGSKAHTAELDEEGTRNDIAAATLGASPASLERLFDEALLQALRHGREAFTIDDVWTARTEMEVGLPEPNDYEPHELETIAVHESGHATVAFLVGKGRRLEMLSVIKRRDALGFLAHRLDAERFTQKRSELIALIQISLAGMVAEEMYFGESGTGPGGDLASATKVAAEMVGSLGLGDSLISYRALDDGPLGGNLVAKVLGSDHGRKAVDKILHENKSEVRHLLEENRHILEALRDALLDRHELVDDEILEVVDGAKRLVVGPREIDLRPELPVVSAAEERRNTPES